MQGVKMQSESWISRRRLFAVVAFALVVSLQACGGGDSALQATDADASSAASQASHVADAATAPMPGDAASATEGPSKLRASELAQVKQLSQTAVGSLPCGLTPGNDWLAQNDKGDNSDPLNMIICLGGVTWDEVFASLVSLHGRTFIKPWPFPDVKGPLARGPCAARHLSLSRQPLHQRGDRPIRQLGDACARILGPRVRLRLLVVDRGEPPQVVEVERLGGARGVNRKALPVRLDALRGELRPWS
jgi:hypothetical protein